MWAFLGGLFSIGLDLLGDVGLFAKDTIQTVTGTAVGLGEHTFKTVGKVAWPVLTTGVDVGAHAVSLTGQLAGSGWEMLGETWEGGLDILGGLPKATKSTIDYLGELSPYAIQGLQAYQTFFPADQAGQVTQGRGVQLGGLPGQPRAQPVMTGQPMMAGPGQEGLPLLSGVGPAYGVTLPEWARTAPDTGKPDILIYAAIGLIGVLLLRK